MLDKVSIPSPPLEPPVSLLISCLASIPFYDKSYVTGSRPFPAFNVDKLTEILDLSVRAYRHDDMDSIVPLIGLLLLIAQSASSEVKVRLRTRLLPADQDRTTVLGQGDSLSHRLLRLGTEPMTPRLKDLVPALLFELSDKDPKQFVHNIGFGYGAGLLYSMGIPFSKDDLEVENSEYAAERSEVNPITGQRRDMEPKFDLPEMTEEEKEREAERLFVLFERFVLASVPLLLLTYSLD